MASLKDTIKSNTGLAQMSAEELAAQQGRAPSRQPLETAVLGGNKDQAKMAGTPAQKTAALRTNIQETEDLATNLRRQQARTAQTDEEQQKIAGAEKLSGLGGLGERVGQMAEANLAAARTTEPGDLSIKAGTNPVIADNLAIIQQFKAGSPQSMAAVQAIEAELGRDLAEGELDQYVATTEEQLQKDLVVDAIETGELPLQDFGFESVEELAGLLQVDPAELSQMNMKAFQDVLDTAIQQEYNQTATLEAQANDPRLGAAQRAEARSQLRDMGFVGVASAESEIDQLADEFEQDTQLEFGDETYSVDELLSSEKVSGLVAGYLQGLDKDGNPITEEAEAFKENHPDLADFAIKYQGQFENAIADLDKDIIAEAQLADKNAGYATPAGDDAGANIEAALDQIFPGFSTEAVTYDYMDRIEQDYPGLAALYSGDTSDAQKIAGSTHLAAFAENAPRGFAEQLMKMSQDELTDLGFYGAPGNKAWTDFMATVDQGRLIDNIDTSSTSSVANVFKAGDASEFEQTLKDLQTAYNAGLVPEDKMPQIPGLLEGDWDQVKEWLQESAAPDTIRDVIESSPDALANQYQDWKSTAGAIDTAGMMISAFENDNVVDSDELITIIEENKEASLSDLATALDALEDDQFADDAAVGVAEQALKTATQEEINTILAEGTDGLFTGDMDQFLKDLQNNKLTQNEYDLLRAQVAALTDIPGVEDKVNETLDMLDEWMAKPSDAEEKTTTAAKKTGEKVNPERAPEPTVGFVSGTGLPGVLGGADEDWVKERDKAIEEAQKQPSFTIGMSRPTGWKSSKSSNNKLRDHLKSLGLL